MKNFIKLNKDLLELVSIAFGYAVLMSIIFWAYSSQINNNNALYIAIWSAALIVLLKALAFNPIKTSKRQAVLNFKQRFYEAWYKIPDDLKQVIVFPQQTRYSTLCIERINGKRRTYKSIDACIENLEEGIQVDVLFSPKKIQQCAGISTLENELVQEFIDSLVQYFKGLNLLFACGIIYDLPTKKHQKGKKPQRRMRKIKGYIARIGYLKGPIFLGFPIGIGELL